MKAALLVFFLFPFESKRTLAVIFLIALELFAFQVFLGDFSNEFAYLYSVYARIVAFSFKKLSRSLESFFENLIIVDFFKE